jgi:hypothetical protein
MKLKQGELHKMISYDQLTKTMEQNPWEAIIHSASHLLWNPEVHYWVQIFPCRRLKVIKLCIVNNFLENCASYDCLQVFNVKIKYFNASYSKINVCCHFQFQAVADQGCQSTQTEVITIISPTHATHQHSSLAIKV